MQENGKGKNILDYLRGKKKLPLLIAGIALGILLLIGSGSATSGNEVSKEPDAFAQRTEELTAYEARIKKEVEVLCESVAGISDASVMISFSRGYRLEYAEDADGDPLTVGSGSNEEAVYGALLPPAVAGVGIVCRGGAGADAQRVLVELVSTALGIPSNRVYIAGK